MQDPRNVRNTMESILKELFIFVEQMFDQDVSFIDSDYLKTLFPFKEED